MQSLQLVVSLVPDISFSGFPNYHPMVVHFPIVLLIIAVVAQLICVFKPANSTLRWGTFYLLLGGTVSAFLAINVFDAHVSGDVSNEIFDVYETHHLFADLTFWAAVVATTLRLIANVWLRIRWIELLLMIIVLLTAILVVVTGHYGASLTYVHGVGPQGNNVL